MEPVLLEKDGPAFCAGHDLSEMVGTDRDIHRIREIFSRCSEMMLGLQKLPQPVIAQVHGIATAAGCQLVAACDMAIAEEAEKFGLLNRIVPAEKLAEEARNWAMELAQASRFTLAFGKQAFYHQVDLEEPVAYGYAKEAIAMNALAEDAQEGMKAFLEKRKPEWRDC